MAYLGKLFVLTTIIAVGCSGMVVPDNGNIWAVLVAGSNGFGNYRHQADICHAYHVLREHGVPANNIITMMYDDIAYNAENPRPGEVINAINGSDLYEGVNLDYTGPDVNSTNFLKVITGDEDGMRTLGSGRVLKSGPNDHVFINFVDHGSNYLICFPNDTDELYAPDLLKAFMVMSENNMFAKMVVYIEACESGSLFDNFLGEKLNIFAVTAAKRGQDSYACCWDPEIQNYVGDVFSVNWLEDADIEDLGEETLGEQYSVLVEETNTSNPQEFGTMSIARLPVGQFMGLKDYSPKRTKKEPCHDAVSSPNVPVAILQRKLEKAETPAQRRTLEAEIRNLFKLRRSVDRVVEHILYTAYGNNEDQLIQKLQSRKTEQPLEEFSCYKTLAKHWFKECYGHSTSPYGLQKLHVFVNICTEHSASMEQVIEAMNIVCPQIKIKEGIS